MGRKSLSHAYRERRSTPVPAAMNGHRRTAPLSVVRKLNTNPYKTTQLKLGELKIMGLPDY